MDAASIFVIVLGIVIFLFASHGLAANALFQIFYTPKSIYEESNMNWFGAIIVYILIFPFSFVFAIGGFLRWLFTVGRR